MLYVCKLFLYFYSFFFVSCFKDINKLNYVNLFLIFASILKERYPYYSVKITSLSGECDGVKRVALTTRIS